MGIIKECKQFAPTKLRLPSAPKRSPAENRRDKHLKKNKPPLERDEERRFRNKIGRVVCSKTWEDDVLEEAIRQGIPANSNRVAALLEKYEIYPMPPDDGRSGPRLSPVVMLRCDVCDLIYPPQFICHTPYFRICLDCALSGERPRDTERLLNEKVKAQRVYEKLRSIKLKDREIAVASLWWERHSIREIARLCDLGKTQVHRLIKSASEKIKAAGIQLPRQPAITAPKMFLSDPHELNRRYASTATT